MEDRFRTQQMCDFHGFRTVASGHKRVEENTTGAFGIGFTAVYQLTDRPELISSGRHWIVDELQDEAKRIEECAGCVRCRVERLPGTRFILPWAMDAQSEMRSRLGVDPVDPSVPGSVLQELLESIPLAMLFLKRLDRVAILRNGELKVQFERSKGAGSVTVTDGDTKREWLIVEASFNQSADTFRRAHAGKVELKRSSKIALAIPKTKAVNGVFCAFLPTQQPTDLPFHLNADFFPKSDRKGIVVGNDFQSVWNGLAIAAAAEAFSAYLEWIRDRVAPSHLWKMIDATLNTTTQANYSHKALVEFSGPSDFGMGVWMVRRFARRVDRCKTTSFISRCWGWLHRGLWSVWSWTSRSSGWMCLWNTTRG